MIFTSCFVADVLVDEVCLSALGDFNCKTGSGEDTEIIAYNVKFVLTVFATIVFHNDGSVYILECVKFSFK